MKKQSQSTVDTQPPMIINEPPKTYMQQEAAMISRKAKNMDSINAITADTDRMVHGEFINIEHPGQPGTITCKFYKGQTVFHKVFTDGEKATIPLSVARHINENCVHEEHGHILDEKGAPVKTGKKRPRYKFSFSG